MPSQKTLMESIHQSVHQFGVRLLAEILGKGPSTLYNEVIPYSDPDGKRTHKLGVLDWDQILARTGDYSSLHLLNRRHGFVGMPIPQAPLHRTDWLVLQASAAREHGEAAGKLLEAIAENSDGGAALTDNERKKCAQEAYEAALAQLAIYAALNDEGLG